jgi:hypothetical protein
MALARRPAATSIGPVQPLLPLLRRANWVGGQQGSMQLAERLKAI